MPDAWLSGPLPGIPTLLMPAAHSLLDARTELTAALTGLTAAQVIARPGGAASIAFHVRHLCGSLDRLYTYAEDRELSDAQREALAAERAPDPPAVTAEQLLAMIGDTVERALARLAATDERSLTAARTVGARRLPSTVLGLLFHAAEHTRRHAGQVVTTAKIVRGAQAG